MSYRQALDFDRTLDFAANRYEDYRSVRVRDDDLQAERFDVKALHVGCFAVMVLVFSMPAMACSPEAKVIRVKGDVHVVLEPDYAEWVVDLVVTDKQPAIAMGVDKKAVESLRKIMRGADIDKVDLIVGRPQIAQNTLDKKKWGEGTGYINTTVRRRVVFKQRDLEEVSEVLLAIHDLGVKYRYAYKSSKYDDALRQAKHKALSQAKAKAEGQAAMLGQKIGPAVFAQVSDGESNQYAGGLFGLTDALTNTDQDIEEEDPEAAGVDGRVHIRVHSSVDFELMP